MEERSGQFLLIPSSNYANQVNLDNEEVKAFYSGNANSFMTEEELDVEYLSIKIEDIATDDGDLEDVFVQLTKH